MGVDNKMFGDHHRATEFGKKYKIRSLSHFQAKLSVFYISLKRKKKRRSKKENLKQLL